MTPLATDSDPILVDTPAPGVMRITLNRPDALNSFSFPMYRALIQVFAEVRHDPAVRVIILTGAGRAFSAGHDTRNGGKPDWVPEGLGKIQSSRLTMSELSTLPGIMRGLPQPIIAAVNGAAAGVGYSLAVASDLCIAAQSAKFVNALHNAGTGAELGMSWMLPRAVGTQRAAELLLTARPVMAEEAERIGLILRAVPDAGLMDAALELADRIVVNSPIGIALTKASLWCNQSVGSLDAAIELESRAVFLSQATADTAEKRRSSMEKRRPRFDNT